MHTNKLDFALVVDLEATCWDKESERANQEQEIIEIGISEIDLRKLEITRSEAIIVRPTRSTVSNYCTNLTTLTQDFVDKNGIYFIEACSKIEKEWDSSLKSWWSFGDWDRKMLATQCKREGVHFPFSETHYNIKNLASILLSLKREKGLKKMLEFMNIKLEGTHHRGVDDATNTAKIIIQILKRIRNVR